MAKLYFYYSAMNAGKSTTLLQSSHNYRERGMDTLLFTPSIDNRFARGTIHSRIGLSADAVIFDRELNLYEHVVHAKETLTNLRCILIDEAQFLSKDQVLQAGKIADTLSIPVLAYGLRSDFQGNAFEGSLHLLIFADELIELKTICHCGRKATMNMRLDEHGRATQHGEQIQIGGNESYVATCRRHFLEGIATHEHLKEKMAHTE